MLRTARRRSRMERRTGSPATRGAWHGCSTPASARSRSASSSTSSAPATRVSRLLPCVWWALRSSWQVWRAVCCVFSSAYLRSLAVDGEPSTRRTEDCLGAGKARRCPWRGVSAAAAEAARAPAPGPRSARPRAAWTRRPATCPRCPAARRTSVCAATAPPRCTRRHYTRLRRIRAQARQMVCERQTGTGCTRAVPTKARCSGAGPRTAVPRVQCRRGWSRPRRTACPRRRRRAPWRRRCPPAPWPAPPRAAHPRATSPSPADPMASSCLAPHNCAPNPQAIKVFAILLFLPNSSDDVTISRTATDIGYVIAGDS